MTCNGNGFIKTCVGTGSGGASTSTADTTIVPPPKAGLIPRSEFNSATGKFQYGYEEDPLKNINPAADADKALAIDATQSTDGNPILKALSVVTMTPSVSQILGQSGIITYPTITVLSDGITVRISAYRVSFYDSVKRTNAEKDVPQQDIRITNAKTNTPGADITTLILTPALTYNQVSGNPAPSDTDGKIPICKVYHQNGGALKSEVYMLAPSFGTIEKNFREGLRLLGIQQVGFVFTYDKTQGLLSQTSPTAALSGYGIAAASSSNRNIVPFPTGSITAEYVSWNPADRVAAVTNFNRTYKVDNPSNGTSASIQGGNYGIVTIWASVSGKYIMVAPQEVYTTKSDAFNRIDEYSSKVALPKEYRDVFAMVAAAIVTGTVDTSANTSFDVYTTSPTLKLTGGGSIEAGTLPATDGVPAGYIVAVGANGTFVLKNETVIGDLSGAQLGDVLQSDGAKFIPVSLSTATQAFASCLYTTPSIMKIMRFRFTNSEAATVPTTTDDYAGFGIDLANTRVNTIAFSSDVNANRTIPMSIHLVYDNPTIGTQMLMPNTMHSVTPNNLPLVGTPIVNEPFTMVFCFKQY